ncbi:MAG TPA: hypothetical protein PLK34_02785 [Candidatus Pacearchaeota archaeon]|nr:hypothetical protein [Candidatus Pacearchaeota archaeon]
MIKQVDSSQIPYDSLLQGLCRSPYHNHSAGCPNYNQKQGCPPKKLINEVLDFNKEIYVISTEFPIGEFAERMRLLHPEWKRECYPDNSQKHISLIESVEEKLRKKHPDWPEEYYSERAQETWNSSREWYNPRRWQPSARKKHENEKSFFSSVHPSLEIISCPEAHGVNITGLMHSLGIKLNWQWPPEHSLDNESYLVSLAGYLLNKD